MGKTERTERPSDFLDVEAVFVHPQYDPRTRHNDVALLRLAEPVPLGVEGRPACLQTNGDDDVEGGRLTASGMAATGRCTGSPWRMEQYGCVTFYRSVMAF